MKTVSRQSLSAKSLISSGGWSIEHDFTSVLKLREPEWDMPLPGFVIRHYWLPATDLIFRKSKVKRFESGQELLQEYKISRCMVRCRANECAWREIIDGIQEKSNDHDKIFHSELLCSYDCFEQTYLEAKPILFCNALSEGTDILLARNSAMQKMSLLVPPGLVFVGASWCVMTDCCCMNYKIESEERLNGTSVLVIKRNGYFFKNISDNFGEDNIESLLKVNRVGSTLFAWKRGILLEDRWCDRILESSSSMSYCGGDLSEQSVLRLICSMGHEAEK